MDFADLLGPDHIACGLKATSKKQALQAVADHASSVTDLPARDVFNALLERERLGSTGVGGGAAIPHGKFEGLDRLHVLIMQLETPIDFDAVDHEPVDLLAVLLAPEAAAAEHLKALARVSRLLRDQRVRQALRGCDSSDAIYALVTAQDQAA